MQRPPILVRPAGDSWEVVEGTGKPPRYVNIDYAIFYARRRAALTGRAVSVIDAEGREIQRRGPENGHPPGSAPQP